MPQSQHSSLRRISPARGRRCGARGSPHRRVRLSGRQSAQQKKRRLRSKSQSHCGAPTSGNRSSPFSGRVLPPLRSRPSVPTRGRRPPAPTSAHRTTSLPKPRRLVRLWMPRPAPHNRLWDWFRGHYPVSWPRSLRSWPVLPPAWRRRVRARPARQTRPAHTPHPSARPPSRALRPRASLAYCHLQAAVFLRIPRTTSARRLVIGPDADPRCRTTTRDFDDPKSVALAPAYGQTEISTYTDLCY